MSAVRKKYTKTLVQKRLANAKTTKFSGPSRWIELKEAIENGWIEENPKVVGPRAQNAGMVWAESANWDICKTANLWKKLGLKPREDARFFRVYSRLSIFTLYPREELTVDVRSLRSFCRRYGFPTSHGGFDVILNKLAAVRMQSDNAGAKKKAAALLDTVTSFIDELKEKQNEGEWQ